MRMLGFLRRLFDKESSSSDSVSEKASPLYIVGTQNAAPAAPSSAPKKPAATPTKAGSEEPFDPYNTGAFNRSKSWERISKQRDR